VTTVSAVVPTIDEVCARAMRLPCSPALLPRLINVLISPDSSAEEIAGLITVDSALAASTLRLANSAFYSAGGKVESVSEAVIRLGQRELYRLAALALVGRWETGTGGRGEPGDFCRHALCTALAAEVLAETSERVDPQVAYTAGLVCDLGKLALAHACGPFVATVRAHCSKNGGTWSDAERAVLGYSHAEVGGRLLRAWSFPSNLADAAEFGERPAESPEESRALLAHLHAAKYVATSFGPGVAEDGFLFDLNTPFLLEWGFTPELLQETMTVVHERARARLQEKLTHGAVSL
jgi:HD-like signal output (HDOD) protein